MKRFLLVFFFAFALVDLSAQDSMLGFRIRFACDSCAGSQNPLAYPGGNIISSELVHSPEGNYLKLITGSVIDTNATPAYFDIYTTFLFGAAEPSSCTSFRAANIGFGNSYNEIPVNLVLKTGRNAGCRIWLASSSGLPGPGESTFQPDPSDPSSQIIVEEKIYSGSYYSVIYASFYGSEFEGWSGMSKINMYGFTALTPDTEYQFWEVNMGLYLPVRLAGYDCSIPGAVRSPALKDKIKIFPLPATESVNIEVTDIPQEYQVQLFSSSGIMVYEGYHNEKATIPLSGLEKGLYLIKINFGEVYYTDRIVKN